MNNKNICNNCGKQGHLFHQCKLPITSYGVIIYRKFENTYQYLMIRRKDTFGYNDFIRGKYSVNNIIQLQNIFNEMSWNEKQQILQYDFPTLWKLLWVDSFGFQHRGDETTSGKKFETLRNGILVNDKLISLKTLVENSCTHWEETEWEFPKGRRNYQEKDLDCALREFEEETGYSKNDITLVDNLLPFEEIFIGSNHKSYKHKYYLAFMRNSPLENNDYQRSEVSKIEWKTIQFK